MISIQIVDNEAECERLWKSFCPSPDLWNEWETRKRFHSARHRFHFIRQDVQGRLVGLVPLIYDREWECYTYFGGFYPENNRLMVLDKRYANELIGHIPSPTDIYYLSAEDAKLNPQIQKSDKHYFLDLDGFSTFEDILAQFSKKHKKNLKYDLKNIDNLHPKIVRGRPDAFEELIAFNQHRFGKDSDYHEATILSEMRSLFRFAMESDMLDLISVSFGEKTSGVAFGIVHNRIYYSINTGRDIVIENLGKFLIREQIKSALERGCTRIDFLTGDDPWKDLWNLQWEDTYELIV